MAGSVGSDDGDYGFQIAPMVDVVFVLLLFFMACAGMQIVEKELTIDLPSGQPKGGKASSQIPKVPIIIEIAANGQVSANNSNYGDANDKELKALREWLASAIGEFEGDDPVIIRPDPQTIHARVVDVLNAAAACGVKNLTFG